jgi:hypothetical protein
MQVSCSNPAEAIKILDLLKDLPVGTLSLRLSLGETLRFPLQWRMLFSKRVAMR